MLEQTVELKCTFPNIKEELRRFNSPPQFQLSSFLGNENEKGRKEGKGKGSYGGKAARPAPSQYERESAAGQCGRKGDEHARPAAR